MTTTIRWATLAASVGLWLIAAPRLDAQMLQVGTWTGTAVAADGSSHDVTYDVTMPGDTLHITMNLPKGPPLEFADLHFDQGRLTFFFQVDQKVTCSLKPRNEWQLFRRLYR